MSLEKIPNFLRNSSEGEMRIDNGDFYEFGTFRLNLAERSLADGDVKMALTPKAFDVLAILVQHAGHLVEKEEIFRAVWPDSFVEEANLSRIVHTLRRTLGETGDARFIETVSKKGYRFVVPVTVHHNSEQNGHDNVNLVPSDETTGVVAESTSKRKIRRYVLWAAGSLTAIVLVFLLFNFQSWGPRSSSSRRFTTNEEAYRLFQLGAGLAAKTGRKNSEKSVEYFAQAVKLDPNYAPAYAGLASAHTSMAITAGGDTHEQYIRAKTAIEKALAIDNDLAETYSALGEIKWICEWDFPGAETAHKRALQLDPNSASAHRKYAIYLTSMGRFDESIAQIKTAVDLEPSRAANQRVYAQILLYARLFDDAITRSKQTLEMDSDLSVSHHFLIWAYRAKGDDAQAFEWFLGLEKANGGNAEEIQAWQALYDRSGWRGILERQFAEAQEAERKGTPNYMNLANLSIELSQYDQAFAYLEKTYAQRQWAMVMLNVNPRYDPLRADPRFDALLKRVGLK